MLLPEVAYRTQMRRTCALAWRTCLLVSIVDIGLQALCRSMCWFSLYLAQASVKAMSTLLSKLCQPRLHFWNCYYLSRLVRSAALFYLRLIFGAFCQIV